MAIEIKPYEPSPLEQQKQVFADALRAAGYGDDDNYRVNELAEGLTTLSEFLPGFGDVQGMREGKYLMEQGAPYVGGAVVGLSMLPFVPAGRIVRYFRDRGLLPRPKPTETPTPETPTPEPEQLQMSLPEPSPGQQPTQPQTTQPTVRPTPVVTTYTDPQARNEAEISLMTSEDYNPGGQREDFLMEDFVQYRTVGEPYLVETLAEKSILGNKNFQNPNKKYNVNNLINSTIATVKEGPARENLKRQLDDFIPQELREGKATIQEVLDAIAQSKPTIRRNVDSRDITQTTLESQPRYLEYMPNIPTEEPVQTVSEAMQRLMPLKYSEESYSIHSPVYGQMFSAPGHNEVGAGAGGTFTSMAQDTVDARNTINRIYTSRSGLYDIGGEKVYIPAEGQSGIYGFDSPEKIKTNPKVTMRGPYLADNNPSQAYDKAVEDIQFGLSRAAMDFTNTDLLNKPGGFVVSRPAFEPVVASLLKEGKTFSDFQNVANEFVTDLTTARNNVLENYGTTTKRYLDTREQMLKDESAYEDASNAISFYARQDRMPYEQPDPERLRTDREQLIREIPDIEMQLQNLVARAEVDRNLTSTTREDLRSAEIQTVDYINQVSKDLFDAEIITDPDDFVSAYLESPINTRELINELIMREKYSVLNDLERDLKLASRDLSDSYSQQLSGLLERADPDDLSQMKAPPLASDWFSLHMKTSLNRAVQEGADKVHFPVNSHSVARQRGQRITPARADMFTEDLAAMTDNDPALAGVFTSTPSRGARNMADTYRRQTNKGLKQIEAEYGIKVPTTKYVDENKNEFIEISLTPELKKAFSKIVYSRGGPVGPMMPLKYVENRRDTSPDFRKEIQEARMDARREMREKDIGGPYDVVGLFDDVTKDKFRNPITMMAADLIDNLERAQELNRYAKRTDPQMNIGQQDRINMAKTGDLSFDLGGKLLPEYARTTTAGEQPFDLFLNINRSRAIPGRPFDDSGTEYELQARMLTDPEREAAFFDKVGGALKYTGIPFLEDRLRGGLEALYAKLDPESYEANRRGERIRSYLDE